MLMLDGVQRSSITIIAHMQRERLGNEAPDTYWGLALAEMHPAQWVIYFVRS